MIPITLILSIINPNFYYSNMNKLLVYNYKIGTLIIDLILSTSLLIIFVRKLYKVNHLIYTLHSDNMELDVFSDDSSDIYHKIYVI